MKHWKKDLNIDLWEGADLPDLEKYAKILQVLDCDLAALKDINAPSILYGDFNAHIGATSHKHGVKDKNEKVGKNGQLLHDWLHKWGKVVVNNQPVSKGTWTLDMVERI